MQPRPKIVFISFFFWPPHFGGELKIAIERFISLSQRGYDVIVFTSGVPGFAPKEQRDGLKIFRSPCIGNNRVARRINRLVFWLWVYWKLFLEHGVKVVHIETIISVLGYIPAHFYALILLRIAKLKRAKTVCVHSLASDENEYFNIRNRWEDKYYSSIDHIVCVSDALFQAVKKVHPETAWLEPCGIHEEIFVPIAPEAKQKIRSENNIRSTDVIFTFLGSFEKRKGLDLLVTSFVRHKTNSEWKMWLIGPYRREESQYIHADEVQELIEPLAGLEENVKLWGRVDDRKFLAQLIASSDIFVFPTRREGFGIAPLEAMSCGVPVIVSRIPGITDMGNIDNVTGIYIQPGNLHELEAALIKLAGDAELRKKMGEQGRARIVDAFSWEIHIDHWETIYSSHAE